jgi:hypothetical protein
MDQVQPKNANATEIEKALVACDPAHWKHDPDACDVIAKIHKIPWNTNDMWLIEQNVNRAQNYDCFQKAMNIQNAISQTLHYEHQTDRYKEELDAAINKHHKVLMGMIGTRRNRCGHKPSHPF